MQLTVGQKVAYPNQGVCLVESKSACIVGGHKIDGFTLRVVGDNSTIFVPIANTDGVGIRPLISLSKCRKLLQSLADDFEDISLDWKMRSREFAQKLHSGDVFAAADVLKKLTFLSHAKKLSFREQTMLEKARFLIISEITNADKRANGHMEDEVAKRVEAACSKHRSAHTVSLVAAAH